MEIHKDKESKKKKKKKKNDFMLNVIKTMKWLLEKEDFNLTHYRTVFCQTFSRIELVNGNIGDWVLGIGYSNTISQWYKGN